MLLPVKKLKCYIRAKLYLYSKRKKSLLPNASSTIKENQPRAYFPSSLDGSSNWHDKQTRVQKASCQYQLPSFFYSFRSHQTKLSIINDVTIDRCHLIVQFNKIITPFSWLLIGAFAQKIS